MFASVEGRENNHGEAGCAPELSMILMLPVLQMCQLIGLPTHNHPNRSSFHHPILSEMI